MNYLSTLGALWKHLIEQERPGFAPMFEHSSEEPAVSLTLGKGWVGLWQVWGVEECSGGSQPCWHVKSHLENYKIQWPGCTPTRLHQNLWAGAQATA